jgi:hypothetical protein
MIALLTDGLRYGADTRRTGGAVGRVLLRVSTEELGIHGLRCGQRVRDGFPRFGSCGKEFHRCRKRAEVWSTGC